MNKTPSALVRTVVFAIGSTSLGSALLAGCSDAQYANPHTDLPPADYAVAESSAAAPSPVGAELAANPAGVAAERKALSNPEAPLGNEGALTDTDTPSTTSPNADAPSADPSNADAPAAVEPEAEPPNPATPVAVNGEAPAADRPSSDAPSSEAASPEAPSTEAPVSEEPTERPVVDPNNALYRSGRVDTPIGTNLGGITDSDPSWPFVDLMKTSRPWISGNTDGTWDDGRAFDLDENGWVRSLAPNQVAKTLMFWDLEGRYPMGEFTVLYDGRGSLEYFGGAQRISTSSGKDVLEVGPGGIGLTITAVDAADPIRNIRVLMPGGSCSDDSKRYCDADNACSSGASCVSFEDNHATQVFHPQYMTRLQTYGVLRFMDWGATNHSSQQTWADRPKPADARYSIKGAPVEVMTDLANRLGVDAWFTIPHLADDDYIAGYADVVQRTLRQDLKAYVEHSNEVWNGMFAQSAYASTRGLELGLSSEPYEAQLRYHSRRSVDIFKIFEQTFGGLDRLVRVMASQAANSWTSEVALDFENASQYTDAVAIAPYFGGYFGSADRLSSLHNMNASELLDLLEHEAVPETVSWMKEQSATAAARGVALIAYEGGQHLAGVAGAEEDSQLNALFDAANRDPRMKTIYEQYLNAWRDNGGELFAHFIDCGRFTKWGRWGSLEFLNQPRVEAPKFDALQSFIETNTVWW